MRTVNRIRTARAPRALAAVGVLSAALFLGACSEDAEDSDDPDSSETTEEGDEDTEEDAE